MSIPSNAVAVDLDPDLMTVLGSNATEILYWDFSKTEDFYLYTGGVLYRISPKGAYLWFAANRSTNPGVIINYNPWSGAFQNQMAPLSDIV